MAEQLASAALPEFVETPGAVDSGPRTRFELRLSPTEIDALRARAESEGVAPQLWLIRAMRAQLTGRYQITDAAVQGAAELHQELLTIARNINQVARVLNTTKVISAGEMQAVLATHKSNLRDLAELKDQFARILSGYSVRFPLRRVEG
ncbi:plasmid mobilization relaxosome protein MobC [Methylovirgula sp. 4M-Z18]|uniref:plasmid mobilization relaxosome protein MobC n=1 Tax=Methylovirgula sp. 4M-Z18 TaxID=2293567 RepID=UPI001314FBB1|nr:plasmid mobilization relaxosome protein MobC [Methylovirgula sp. 4M-Z18]